MTTIALQILTDSLSGADLAALRADVRSAIETGALRELAASVAEAHPPTADSPEAIGIDAWESALRAL